MGLKDDIITAKVEALKLQGVKEEDINIDTGSPIEVEAELTKEAVANFLTQCSFKITKLNAPVVVESMKTPDQLVNIELETMMGEYGPLLDTLKKLGSPLGLTPLIDELEGKIEKAITPLLEGGAKLVGLDLGKDDGGLEAVGYVHIGEDPDSVDGFDVEDESGQREFTSVQVFREDIEDLL
jgi:hypothetical protein